MRPQGEAIFEAIKGGAFQTEVPFLPQAETVQAVNAVARALGCPALLANDTLQNWFKRSFFKLHRGNPKLRNRLYSTIDVVKLAVMVQATALGLPVSVASDIASKLPELLADPRWDGDLDAKAHGLLAVHMVTHGFEITTPDFTKPAKPVDAQKFLGKRNAGMVLLIDWKRLARFSVEVCMAKWRESAERIVAAQKQKGSK